LLLDQRINAAGGEDKINSLLKHLTNVTLAIENDQMNASHRLI